MKKSLSVLALAFISFVISAQAYAQQVEDGPWLVRLRALTLRPANQSDPVGGVGAPDTLTVNNKTFPELDISYFFTSNWATELILSAPQRQDVSLNGTPIGSFTHLPPTLTLQYHFTPEAKISPYLGAGVNYTKISEVNLLNGNASLNDSSVGPAVQAGVDFKIDRNWSLNLDVKKLQIRSNVYAGGQQVSAVRVDPLLVGVGVGYRF